jgi:hypothetical protein
MKKLVISGIILGAFVVAATAGAQMTDEQKCLSGRAKATGKYQQCVQKVLAKCYGGTGSCWPDAEMSKCREKYQKAWDKLVLLNAPPCSGNRWVDNGNGTVTDNLTDLVWEQKTDDGSVHDQHNTYYWTLGAPTYLGDGTAFSVFLATLNGSSFAGANDWRVPTFAELMTILNQPYPCATSPCVDSAFGPYSPAAFYWSSTSYLTSNPYDPYPPSAWHVSFSVGAVEAWDKWKENGVRAVRGGS